MNDPNNMSASVSILRARLNAAQNFDAASVFGDDLLALDTAGALSGDAIDFVPALFGTLMRLTRRDASLAWLPILGQLISFSTRPDNPKDHAGQHARQRSRLLLRDWLEQYPDPSRSDLRCEVLTILREAAVASPWKEGIWAIGAIGYRSEETEDILWNLSARLDEVGDAAFACLIELGVAKTTRIRVIEELRRRASHRPARTLVYPIQELADPAFIDLIMDKIARPSEDSADLFSLSLLARIAAAAPLDGQVQAESWEAFCLLVERDPKSKRSRIYSSNNLVPGYNLRAVLPQFFQWFAEDYHLPKGPRPGRYLAYLRFTECIRPGHVAAWHDEVNLVALDILRADACAPSQVLEQDGSPASMIKPEAWEVLFSLGRKESMEWLEEALGGESDPFIAAKILEKASCFPTGQLPPFVRRLVEEPRNIRSQERAPDFQLRRAAVSFARSSATKEAFASLLGFGLLHEDHALMSNAAALSEVAVIRLREGDLDIVDRLLAVALAKEDFPRQAVAVNVLRDLAVEGYVGSEIYPTLATLESDPELPPHVREVVIQVIGHLPDGEVRTKALPLLRQALSSPALEVRARAVEALARHGTWHHAVERIVELLGLSPEAGVWRVANPARSSAWQAAVVALLYRADQAAFSQAVETMVREADFQCAHEVVYKVTMDGVSLPAGLADALVQRLRSVHTASQAETWIFQALAELAPERLTSENWQEEWPDWLPDARAALADALGAIAVPPRSEVAGTILLQLFTDGIYAVRRSAARALARVDPQTVVATCLAWSRSPELELKKRSAELLGWMAGEKEFQECYAILAADPEPLVRPIAERSRTERIHRGWADTYIERICACTSNNSNSSVWQVFNEGRGLSHFGEDQHARMLAAHLRASRVPHVRAWLKRLIEAINSRWQQVTSAWPEPWLSFEGVIEETEAVVMDGSRRSNVQLSLWKQAPSNPHQTPRWGGAFWQFTDSFHSWGNQHEVKIQIAGRESARISVNFESSTGLAIFTGLNNYPVKREIEVDTINYQKNSSSR